MGLENNYYSNLYSERKVNNLEVIWQAIEYKYKELGIDINIEK